MSETPPRKSPTRLQRLRRTIMAGLTIIAPLWVTGWVLKTLFNWADGFSAPLIRQVAKPFGYPEFHIPGLGFVLTFIILWVVGAFAANVVGRSLWQYAREALEGLPLVRTIYAPVQQLMETLTSPGKAGFEKVVLVEYPRTGLWTLGFLAGNVPPRGRSSAGAQHLRAHGAQSHDRLYAHRAARTIASHRPRRRRSPKDDRLGWCRRTPGPFPAC